MSGNSVSIFRVRGYKKPIKVAAMVAIPKMMYRNPMPLPIPVPMILPTLPARAPLFAISGSKIRSDNGPAIRYASGSEDQAIIRRTANTRPWISGAVLLCQIAWLQPLIIGEVKKYKNAAPASMVGIGGKPAANKAIPCNIESPKMP